MKPISSSPQAAQIAEKLSVIAMTTGTPTPLTQTSSSPKPLQPTPAIAKLISPFPFHGAKSPIGHFDPEAHIKAKANELGGLPGNPTGPVVAVANGYMQRFQGCDIFYSPTTGAHEVHGDVRVKYLDYLEGPSGVLGLPTTDESGSPDGVGRYNHFVGGSIYWSPNTGPMMVRGSIRDVWANQGWETGALKYPIANPYTMYVADSRIVPTTSWGMFENGAILSSNDGAAVALAAEVAPDALRMLIRKNFDQQFHQSPDNVGLQAQVDTVSVTDWTYSLAKSGGRKITFRLYGFHDNGLAPDTNFTAEVELGFDLVWPDAFAEPTRKTLVAGLYSVHVEASGLGSQSLADGIKNGIWNGFYPTAGPDPLTPYVPSGWRAVTSFDTGAEQDGSSIDVIGILVTQDGGLQVLVNPLPSGIGALRQRKAQAVIEDLILGV